MVELSMDKVHKLMKNQSNIRNISVIAHVDHGKSTLTDTLVIKANIKNVETGGARFMDTRADEQQRGITIKSTAISLHFQLHQKILTDFGIQSNGTEFLINLIDSPGHVDFSSEVTAALRVTDGAMVVVDCVDGNCVQTDTVLRQAIAERIKPTLCLNKLDRALLELQYAKLELFDVLRKRVEDFNVKLHTTVEGYKNKKFTVKPLMPYNGEVSFCSGLQQWGFTLTQFSRFYSEHLKFDSDYEREKKFLKILWSMNCYFTSDDPFDKNGKITKEVLDPLRRPFIVFVLNPIYKVRDMCFSGDLEGLKSYLAKFKVVLPSDAVGSGKPLFKIVMRTWLPAADCLLEQIIIQLPSPIISQKYRASLLYEGCTNDDDQNPDPCYVGIRDADPEGELMMYVSKMVPYSDNRFIAFGRVFSGTIRPGLEIRIQGQDYVVGSKNDLSIKNIQRAVVMMGNKYKDIDDCPAGNIIGLIGIDNALKKTGTITTYAQAHNIRSMKFSVSPVVKYSVKPKNPCDLPKLKQGLIKLSKSDPLCVINFSDNGELTIAGAGELHLEICINDLKNDYACVDIVIEEPIVSYLEGIQSETTSAKMSKSANKHNRICMTCEPLDKEIIDEIEKGNLISKDSKERGAMFRDFGINEDWPKKILFYGPEDKGPNIIVDTTKGIQYLNEIKEYMRDGFREVTVRGPLIGENLRGVRFNLTDVTLHADAIHRTGNQITAPVTSVCRGLILNSKPILYEPMFYVEINVSTAHIGSVSSVLGQRRGTVEEYKDENGIRTTITGYLPVRESFGFNAELMSQTKGEASCVLSYSHYDMLPGDISDEKGLVVETVNKVRKKRGMSELKKAETYFDKL